MNINESRPTLYAITATVTTYTKRAAFSAVTKQIPSFLLNGDALGIVSEAHAEEIARDIISAPEGAEVHVTAVKL